MTGWDEHQGMVMPQVKLPPWGLSIAAFLLCWGVFLTYYHFKFHLNVPPATSGDEIDYDSIGWELSHDRGFRIDTGQPEFRAPYDRAAAHAPRFQLGPPQQTIVTYRPPLFPWAISIMNRCFGRQFWSIRVMNAGFMAATLMLIVLVLSRRFGWQGALAATVLFMIVDVRTRLYGRAILTESMALFLCTVTLLALLRLHELLQRQQKRATLQTLLTGVAFGSGILTRSLLILWLPGLTLLVFWMICQQRMSVVKAIAGTSLFLAGTGIVLTPWAVRNVQVTGEWMPLGTQGLVQLSAAYGDPIWNSRGRWVNLDQFQAFDEVLDRSRTPLENEIAKAKWSRQQALNWIREHPLKTLALFPMKIFQESRPQSILEAMLLFFLIVGAIAERRTPLGQILLAVIAINLVAIGLTWSVDDGRFLVPVLFPIHVLAAIGLVKTLQSVSP